jgi:hypothetical protein
MAERKRAQVQNSKDSESKETKAPEAAVQKAAPKPYVHIDTFMLSAVPMYGLSKVQAAGFKVKMQGQHYQRDEQVFLKALKEHFNLK